MVTTVYAVGDAFETTDPDTAERFSRQGFRVTASTGVADDA